MSEFDDPISVLYVDDEPGFADMVASYLERESDRISVRTATSAATGVERLDDDVDCIVSDYEMPGGDGIEFLEDVRERYPTLPFILYTGKGSEEVASDAISAGATDYLQKESGTDQYTILANRIENVVQQRRDSVARARTERRLTQLTDHSPDVFWMFTADWSELLFVNEAYDEIYGQSTAELVEHGFNSLEVVHPEDRDRVEAAMQRLSAGEEIDVEHRVQTDGESHGWVWVQGEPVRDSTGEVVRVAGFTRDITDRKRQERRFKAFVEQSSDLVSVLNRDGTVQYLSPSIESLLGYDPETLVGDLVFEYVHPDDRDRMLGHFERLVSDPNADPTVEYRLRAADGSWRWMESRGNNQLANPAVDGIVVNSRDITERKEYEQQLQQARTRMEFALDTTDAIVWSWNVEADETEFYPSAETLYGTEIDGWEDFAALIHPDDRQQVQESLDRALDTGELKEEEIRILRDGEVRWIDAPGQPILDDEGPDRLIGVARDITERKERENVLYRDKRAMDEAPVGISISDPSKEDNPIIYVNDRFEELTGYSEAEATGRNCRFLQGPDTDPEAVETMRTAIENGERVTVELQNYRKDGSEFWNQVSIAPVHDEDGDVVNYVGFQQDVTPQRRRRTVLREMYEIISDRHQTFEEQVTALLELGRAELGTDYGTLSEIRDDDYIFQVVDLDDDSFQAGDVAPLSATNCEIVANTEETLVIGDVGRDAPEEMDRLGYSEWGITCYLGAPVYLDDRVRGTFCFYGTEAREDGFSDWEVTLVNLMGRWVSYELQRLQVTEQLRKKNEQLEQFTSIVSHDLRNPLNVAEGRLEFAMEECSNEHLEAVGRSLDRIDALITDLLTLAREGESATDVEAVDLERVTDSCWATVDTKEARLALDATRTIRADESRLRQLFENLFRNSVEHGPADVTVAVGELDDGFYVEDDGPGIPGDERDDVFEVGYSTSAQGTGFGLNIVKRIADAHGWEIRLTEGPDGGARFEVTGVEQPAD